jgi:hypothetical protein
VRAPRRAACLWLWIAACGDRSPPALWPEPPPPTLAKPIGIDEPARQAATNDGATSDATTDAVATPSEPAKPAVDPSERPPMPPLVP